MSTQAVEASELTEMQGRTERTITVPVMERKVATDPQGVKTEVSVPRSIFVRPMPMRRWAQAMAYAVNIVSALPGTGLDFSNPTQMAFLLTHVIGKVPDEIFAILELATDEKAELFDRVDLDEGLRVVMAVVEVNKDFFVQKVLPLLSEIAPSLKDKIASTFGQTQ